MEFEARYNSEVKGFVWCLYVLHHFTPHHYQVAKVLTLFESVFVRFWSCRFGTDNVTFEFLLTTLDTLLTIPEHYY